MLGNNFRFRVSGRPRKKEKKKKENVTKFALHVACAKKKKNELLRV